MSRVLRLTAGLSAAALALVLAGDARADVALEPVDCSGYPAVRVTVVTSSKNSPAPVLTENGSSVVGLTASKLQSKSVVLAVDISTSMAGKSLAEASSAAQHFVYSKLQDDRIALVSFGSS